MGELDLTYVDPIEAEPIEPPGLYFEHTGRPEHLDADGHAWLGALIAAQLRGHATPSGSPVASPGPDAPNAFEEKAR
jgi:hypothetical protein